MVVSAPERFAIDLATLGRLIGEHLPLAAAATQGETHILRWVNPAFCRLVGTTAQTVLGKPFSDVVLTATADGALELLDRVLTTGQEGATPADSLPDLPPAPEGLPSRSYSAAPLFGSQGHPQGLLVRVDDTTELMLARERAASNELRETNQRLLMAGLRADEQFEEAAGEAAYLNALLESLHEAVTIVDTAGRVLLMNPAAVALWNISHHTTLGDAGQVISQIELRRVDGSPLPPEESPVTRAMRGERFSDLELILVRPDGAQLRLLSSGSAIRDNTKVLLAIVVHRDVTALRLLEQTKEEYLALISHDLRAPLTAVQAEAQLLQRQLSREGNPDNPHIKRTLSIVANARRMNAMIQELLESSRLESGTMQLRKRPLELVQLVSDIIDRLGSQRVHIEPLPAPPRPQVLAGYDARPRPCRIPRQPGLRVGRRPGSRHPARRTRTPLPALHAWASRPKGRRRRARPRPVHRPPHRRGPRGSSVGRQRPRRGEHLQLLPAA
jgi:PAS domain-containing protein